MAQSRKITPRNLTARAAYQVPGNPAVTRPEDAVANCYPGLELDVRNLERRFFPGLVFEFVARNDISAAYTEPMIYGARLAYVDHQRDPDLLTDDPAARRLYADIDAQAGTLAEGRWYVEWIEQAGKRLSMRTRRAGRSRLPLDGLQVWRIVRGLEPDPVTIGLERRDGKGACTFTGWRRRYTDEATGVISGAYQPGEMMQSLCSPWQHDFRDCACNYWAANHPDVVYGEIYPGEPILPGDTAADPERGNVRLDWLRAHRSRELAAGAFNTIPKNRPFQLDHFQINREWPALNVVLNDTEIGELYAPPTARQANPFASPEELATELRDRLAPLEMALAIEYLYARFSLRSPETVGRSRWATLADDLTFARHYLLLTATSEMQHLRWVNELLWDLYDAKLIASFQPVLTPARTIRIAKGRERPRALRPLTPDTLDEYIALEHPSAFIDGAYARVAATLSRAGYPRHMRELAERIVSDGMQHESRFLDIRAVLRTYAKAAPDYPYLRPLRPGKPGEVRAALQKYQEIVRDLSAAYGEAAHGAFEQSGRDVTRARRAMDELLTIGEGLAQRGIGIPFWSD